MFNKSIIFSSFASVLLLLMMVTSVTQAAPPAQEASEWTVMLYQVADDNQLEQDILIDFNEAEIVGSTDEINVVAQVDRFEGSYDGMGDWTSTKRYYVEADGDLNDIGSEEWEDLGEINMADGDSLVDFIAWSVENFPAEKYALIMSDHGIGWVGGFGDPAPGGPGAHDVFLLNWFEHDMLWLMEIDEALGKARDQTGIEKFDLITLDVCLMGQLEVATALEPHTQYMVGSEEVVPGVGMAYAHFLGALEENPSMDGAELAQITVEGFLDADKRLLEPDFSGGAPPEVVAEALFHDSTLTAIDTSGIPAVNEALDTYIASLMNLDLNVIAEARAYAQSYESPFGEDTPSPFIDLGHFAQLTAELSGDENVQQTSSDLLSAIETAIVAERHGPGKPGSTGLAIHLPVKQLYDQADNLGYNTIAARFTDNTQWDEFLAYISGGDAGSSFTRPQAEEETPQTADAESDELVLPDNINEDDFYYALEAIDYWVNEEGVPLEEMPIVLEQEEFLPTDLIEYLTELGVFQQTATRSVKAAGNKPLQLTPLTLSSEVSSITSPVTIETDITGKGLAYVYQFIGRYLPRESVLVIEDIDYIASDNDKTVGGVTYPDWGEGPVNITFDWEPIVYAINNGEQSVRALFEPDTYGASPTYFVQGAYNFADGSPSRYAKLYFRDADDDGSIEMTQVYGYAGKVITNSVGAPREIYPQPGDSFTVIYTGDDNREGATDPVYRQLGETITFTTTPFVIEETPAPSGNYVVGVIAEDINGQRYEEYSQLFVFNPDASSVDGFAPYINEDVGFAMLYPETWLTEFDTENSLVSFFSEDEPAYALVVSTSYSDTATPDEANMMAIEATIEGLDEEGTFENLEFTEAVTTILGTFDAHTVNFSYEIDSIPFYGEVIASTPVEGVTYVMLISAEDTEYDELFVELLDPMVVSFDTFVYGATFEAEGAATPAFAEQTFTDDFSDPESGLFNTEERQIWGQSVYEDDQYRVALPPEGFYYDYYLDETLPDTFMLQATASYTGVPNNAYGLIFQLLPGEESDQLYVFNISGDGYYSVDKSGETFETLIDWTASELIDQTEGGTNTITVVGIDDSYDLYINGFWVDSFTDADLTGGTFGIVTENLDSETPATFFFDEITVGTTE